MDLRFDGKTIIVTGGGSGIGAATAEELATSGAVVIVADLDRANADSVVKSILAKGGKAHACTVDVAKAAEVEAMVGFAVKTTGALHGIVNNAGIGGPSAPTGSYDVDEWQKVIDINLSGSLGISGSDCGRAEGDAPTRPSPAIAGLVRGRVRSHGVFAFLEGAVGDALEEARVMPEGADVAPADLVGVSLEMIVAQPLQAGEHFVDFSPLADEGVQGGFAVASGLLGAQLVAGGGNRVEVCHGVAPWGELHRLRVTTIALRG